MNKIMAYLKLHVSKILGINLNKQGWMQLEQLVWKQSELK